MTYREEYTSSFIPEPFFDINFSFSTFEIATDAQTRRPTGSQTKTPQNRFVLGQCIAVFPP